MKSALWKSSSALVLLVVLSGILCPTSAQPTLADYTGSTALIPGQLFLYWKTPSATTISFGIVASTTGYVAFGIGAAPDGGDGTGADIMLASDGLTPGTVTILDAKVIGKNNPNGYTNCSTSICPDISVAGCTNDFSAASGYRNGSFLVIEYSRPQLSGDQTCDLAVTTGENQVVWAIGPGTVANGAFTQHTVAGKRAVDFAITPPPEDDSCKQYSGEDCKTCTDQSSCVWCDDTSGCSDGKPNGLTITVPKDCKYWFWGQCTIAGEALGTPFTYSILLTLAILIFVCCCLGCCLVIGKLVKDKRDRRDSGFEMKAYH
jgi:hypothetical protein